ncbi:unnamed protein product [Pneumocystis jirovecii]|uniref:Glutamyl-tRNA(Gln) amidotransferase subunit B, mitochondrial n=2 Tax=Pneumocystis jirovecii TaxID=42068 RepID=L0PGV2_PNEJI|nr:unnamed protein product [Pneumocystis jirovecii]
MKYKEHCYKGINIFKLFYKNSIKTIKQFHKYYSTIHSFNLTPAIGLEIHVRLATSIKLFSESENKFSRIPNSSVDFFDKLNKTPILLAIKSAIALSCKFPKKISFDRKHYFYPDQPAGYQITQYYYPLAKNGIIKLYQSEENNQLKIITIKIKQIHLEQDTGKTSYLSNPSKSLIDFNRMGSPLIEIITKPCFSSGKEAGEAIKKIQSILRSANTSDANIEDGGLRCDVNISIGNHPKCEIKNLANCEIKRQISIINLGKEIKKQTLKYDAEKNIIIKLRDKEESVDYRYIPEPDLPEIVLSKKLLKECKKSLPKFTDTVFQKYLSNPYKLPLRIVKTLAKKHAFDYFEKVLKNLGDPINYSEIVANWIVNKLLRQLNIRNISFQKNPVNPETVAYIIKAVESNHITDTSAKFILYNIIEGDTRDIYDIVKSFGHENTSNPYLMLKVCQEILINHKKQVDQYKSGQNKIMKWILGKVIKETQGKFPVEELEQLLKEIINKNNI